MERTQPVADTGFVVALLNRSDRMHGIVTRVYGQHQQILLPQTVLAEAGRSLSVYLYIGLRARALQEKVYVYLS